MSDDSLGFNVMSVRPTVYPDGRDTSLCPFAAEYAAMTDDEFEIIMLEAFNGGRRIDYDEEPEDPDEIEMAEAHLSDRCPECGQVGACGYDELGRPMIHAIPSEDN